MEKWQGKIALITGGSSGIGSAVANKLIDHGVTVISLDLNSNYNDKVHFFKCDVTKNQSIQEVFKCIEEKFNFVHILINCAGIVRLGNITENSKETTKFIDDVIATNFSGLIHVTRAAYELIKKSNDYGIIVNFSSTAGHIIPYPNSMMIYPATKFAVRAFSETLRQELIQKDDKKIRVSNLSPGMTKTNILMNSNTPMEMNAKTIPMPHLLEAEDLADGILYILSTPHHVNVTELTIRPLGAK